MKKILLIGISFFFILASMAIVMAQVDSDGDNVPDNLDACYNPLAPTGMVSYWGFEEESGIIAYDSFNGNNGTISGATNSTGRVRSAFYFRGGGSSFDDYVIVPETSDLRFENREFTLETWVKADLPFPWDIGNLNGNLIRKGIWGYDLEVNGETGQVNLLVDDNGTIPWPTGSIARSSVNLRDNEWEHVAATYNWTGSNGIMKVYVNGNLVGQENNAVFMFSDLGDLFIGKSPNDGAPQHFKGGIDEVAVYNRVLTLPEIQNHYNKGLDGKGYCGECNDTDQDSYKTVEHGCGLDCDDADPDTYPGAPEKCDEKDNNCNESLDDDGIDEPWFNEITECGVGVCASTGVFTCVAGNKIDTCTPKDPSSELCDDEDNDCDGYTDEDFPNLGAACSVGQGICEASGTYVCTPDGLGIECNAVLGEPEDESCNGKDDDCDGETDEDGDALCNDTQFCNGQETCQGESGCQNGIPPSVDDGIDCTEDSCDEVNNVIVNTPNDDFCDNELWCDGTEYCDASFGCQAGTLPDCTINDLPSIATCDNDPDNNPFTWDYFAGFTSTCDETAKSCTTSSVILSFTCDVAQCSAACDDSNACQDTDCDPLDACYDGTFRNYDDATNTCLESCICETNACATFTEVITDDDNDGYDVECDNDCDDADPEINPGANERCNGKDNDCDGDIDEVDDDNDGLNDCSEDKCPGTVPWYAEEDLNQNHYDSTNLNLTETYGCGADQILHCKPGQNRGEYRHGLSPGTLNIWKAQDSESWAPDCQVNGTVVLEGVDKSLLQDTDGDWWIDGLDGDNDNDGVPDNIDDLIDDADPPGHAGHGTPDWWKKK